MNLLPFKDLTLQETENWIKEKGLPLYRAKQIRKTLFSNLLSSFDEMSALPKSLRTILKAEVNINPLENLAIEYSNDGTIKYLFRLHDGETIESVLIPGEKKYTLCISTQVGCAMGCRFCLTAAQGFKRNLSPGEIIEQVIYAKCMLNKSNVLSNIVIMGMGEPLNNYDNVVKAISVITDQEGLDFSNRKVTLSTSGVVPAMYDIGRDTSVNLAVSLNAADNKTRSFLMPVNNKWALEELLEACRNFPLPNRRMITFEYILLAGINDSGEAAQKLSKILRGIRAKINLIPFNPHPASDFRPSEEINILKFQEILISNHYTAIIRKSKGCDISAACGQLRSRNLANNYIE